jgi:hypothetical protein
MIMLIFLIHCSEWWILVPGVGTIITPDINSNPTSPLLILFSAVGLLANVRPSKNQAVTAFAIALHLSASLGFSWLFGTIESLTGHG